MTNYFQSLAAASLLLALAARPSSTQQLNPPKGATRIVVHLRTTPDSAWQLAASALRPLGYSAREPDSTDATLTTDPHYVRGVGLVEIDVHVVADSAGSVIEVSGVYRRLKRFLMIFSALSPERITIAHGGTGSRDLRAWEELAAIASRLPAERIDYATSPR